MCEQRAAIVGKRAQGEVSIVCGWHYLHAHGGAHIATNDGDLVFCLVHTNHNIAMGSCANTELGAALGDAAIGRATASA